MRPVLLVPALTLLISGCADVTKPSVQNESEVITTVELTLVPEGSGDAEVFTWNDPENDGSPVIDPIALPANSMFSASVRFLNALEEPAEDLTSEVADESDEHQVFFTGTAVAEGLLTHAYDDEDANGLPVGLQNTLTAGDPGDGELVVTLRHMPPEGSVVVKEEGAAEAVAESGFAAIGGDNDASVIFAVTVE